MAKRKLKSTQRFLPIKEIRDGIISLKAGGYRAVLMVNSINFDLKSADEQQALIGSYQNFLNGLSFPIQILIQSRTLDLDDYIAELSKTAESQSNELLRAQTNEYTNFISNLIGVASIMSKTFYIVVPIAPAATATGLSLFGRRGPVTAGKKFEDIKTELTERIGVVSAGLGALGLTNVPLNTQELIELFYTTYNVDTARRQKLFSVSNVDASVIRNINETESQ